MFCNKCGAQIDDNAFFCAGCGEVLKGSIIFARASQFYGSLVPVKIFMDGQQIAKVGVSQEVRVVTSIGKHRVDFNLWSGNGTNEIEVTKEHPNIKVNFKVGIGAITSKPKITGVEYI